MGAGLGRAQDDVAVIVGDTQLPSQTASQFAAACTKFSSDRDDLFHKGFLLLRAAPQATRSAAFIVTNLQRFARGIARYFCTCACAGYSAIITICKTNYFYVNITCCAFL